LNSELGSKSKIKLTYYEDRVTAKILYRKPSSQWGSLNGAAFVRSWGGRRTYCGT